MCSVCKKRLIFEQVSFIVVNIVPVLEEAKWNETVAAPPVVVSILITMFPRWLSGM